MRPFKARDFDEEQISWQAFLWVSERPQQALCQGQKSLGDGISNEVTATTFRAKERKFCWRMHSLVYMNDWAGKMLVSSMLGFHHGFPLRICLISVVSSMSWLCFPWGRISTVVEKRWYKHYQRLPNVSLREPFSTRMNEGRFLKHF